jgi:hypothetical protein
MDPDPISFDWYDYASYPIPEGTPLPDKLHQALLDWTSEGDGQLLSNEGSPAWNEWILRWTDRGRDLARAVSEELQCPVLYHNELTGEIEQINLPPSKRVVRRHHRPSSK